MGMQLISLVIFPSFISLIKIVNANANESKKPVGYMKETIQQINPVSQYLLFKK